MNQEASLKHMLRSSSLHANLLLLSRALSRSGFGEVQILDRRKARQRSRFGGCELLCSAQVGTLPVRVVVKVVRDTLRVRMLDELAGTVDRTRADLGLLVTMEDIPPRARIALDGHRRSRVEVIDLGRFARMLRDLGIAVRPSGEPDYAFFSEIEEGLGWKGETTLHGRHAR